MTALAVFGAASSGFAATYALTAANTVPVSYAINNSRATGANVLKPPECAALNLTSIVLTRASGVTQDDGSADLILGNPGADNIKVSANANPVCIVGGAGADKITDTAIGTSVCIISVAATETGCGTVVRRP